jgi:hypothetical protein
MSLSIKISVLLCLFTGVALSAQAQAAVPPPMPAYQPLTAAQLDQVLAPFALYPDPLIAEMLPASALPTQIVLADRYIVGGGDPNQIDQQPWDASVQAMARYPSVLKWMDDNLNVTAQIGQAFLSQQTDVMASIQRLRAAASNLGNLRSSPQQQVIADGGNIEIVPADVQVIYVPVYQPDEVYDENAEDSPFVTYGLGWPIGPWLDYDWDWGNGNLIFWGNGYARPANWWHESSRQRDTGHAGIWRANNHPGAVAANRGDRGYRRDALSRGATPAAIRQELSRPVMQQSERPASVSRFAPAPTERAASVNRPESTGAFLGIQSSEQTRTFSNRGQQSMHSFNRVAPASRPTQSGGGSSHIGGGNSGSGGGHAGGRH